MDRQRKEKAEKKLSVIMCFVVLIAEVLIGFEASSFFGNIISSVSRAESDSPWVFLVAMGILPVLIVAALVFIKATANPKKVEREAKKTAQAYDAHVIDEGTFTAQNQVHQQKKRRFCLIKWGYLFAVVGFYSVIWYSTRTSEVQTQMSVADLPTLEELLNSDSLNELEGKSLLAESSEVSGLPQSTMLAALMTLVWVIHVFAVFTPQPVKGELLPMGDFDPRKKHD